MFYSTFYNSISKQNTFKNLVIIHQIYRDVKLSVMFLLTFLENIRKSQSLLRTVHCHIFLKKKRGIVHYLGRYVYSTLHTLYFYILSNSKNSFIQLSLLLLRGGKCNSESQYLKHKYHELINYRNRDGICSSEKHQMYLIHFV